MKTTNCERCSPFLAYRGTSKKKNGATTKNVVKENLCEITIRPAIGHNIKLSKHTTVLTRVRLEAHDYVDTEKENHAFIVRQTKQTTRSQYADVFAVVILILQT